MLFPVNGRFYPVNGHLFHVNWYLEKDNQVTVWVSMT